MDLNLIKKPVITEKSTANAQFNKYIFEVRNDANKINIKWFGIASFLLKFETNIYISHPNFLKRPNIPTINIT